MPERHTILPGVLTIKAWPLARLAEPVCALTAIAAPERRSLREGWLLPILVCPDGAIIDGATRVAIARADRTLQDQPVPVVVHDLDPLTACTARVRLHRARGDIQVLALVALLAHRALSDRDPPPLRLPRPGAPRAAGGHRSPPHRYRPGLKNGDFL